MRGLHKTYLPPGTTRAIGLQDEKIAILKRLDVIRFLEKCGDADENGCWPWRGSIVHSRKGNRKHKGNGSFRWCDISRLAHRVSYEIHSGVIPRGLCVRHKCDNSICVNPEHLELGTIAENSHDKMTRGRAARKLTTTQIFAIRADKRGQRIVAETYGVRQSLVSAIKRRAIWGWLT